LWLPNFIKFFDSPLNFEKKQGLQIFFIRDPSMLVIADNITTLHKSRALDLIVLGFHISTALRFKKNWNIDRNYG